MLDLKFIRENPQIVAQAIKDKQEKVDFNKFLDLDEQRRNFLQQLESKRRQLNQLSTSMAKFKKKGESTDQIHNQLKDLSQEIKQIEQSYKKVYDQWEKLYHFIPNIPEQDTPLGSSEQDNRTIKIWGEVEKSKQGLDYHQICEKLHLVNWHSASIISQSSFPLYQGDGARLEMALIMFMLDLHTKHHYKQIIPPFLINRDSMFGTGQLPKMEEDSYVIEKDDLFLNPTAEVPVTNIFKGQIIPEQKLPVKLSAFTTCFRREAGSYGKETKGLLRMHQFNKVELVHLVKPEDGFNSLEQLLNQAELVLQQLKLPYRVRMLCRGDMTFASAVTYDLEVWAPISKKFLEVSSVSYFKDFQARRIGLKYQPENGSKQFIHTLNGSALATPRTMIAILEQYQQEDNLIMIPEVLLPYFSGQKVINSSEQ